MMYLLIWEDIFKETIPTRPQAVESVRDRINSYFQPDPFLHTPPHPDNKVDCSIGQGHDYRMTVYDFDEIADGGLFLHFTMWEAKVSGCETLDVHSEEFKTIRDVLEFLNETGLLHLLT